MRCLLLSSCRARLRAHRYRPMRPLALTPYPNSRRQGQARTRCKPQPTSAATRISLLTARTMPSTTQRFYQVHPPTKTSTSTDSHPKSQKRQEEGLPPRIQQLREARVRLRRPPRTLYGAANSASQRLARRQTWRGTKRRPRATNQRGPFVTHAATRSRAGIPSSATRRTDMASTRS